MAWRKTSGPVGERGDARWWVSFGTPVVGGVVVTAALVPYLITAAMGGHAGVWLPAALFPFSFIAVAFMPTVGSPVVTETVWLATAVLTLPAYGALVGLTRTGQIAARVVWVVLAVHLLLAAILLISGDHLSGLEGSGNATQLSVEAERAQRISLYHPAASRAR